MTTTKVDINNVCVFIGPDRRPITGPAVNDFDVRIDERAFTFPEYLQASAEEFAAAAASTLPFSYEATGVHFTGTAILTNDGRIVVVNKSGERGVARLTPEGAARVRASMEAKSNA